MPGPTKGKRPRVEGSGLRWILAKSKLELLKDSSRGVGVMARHGRLARWVYLYRLSRILMILYHRHCNCGEKKKNY